MPEKITDNEFYVVVWENEYGVLSHQFVHLRNGETISQYMQRVHKIGADKIDQIYKRTYAKQ